MVEEKKHVLLNHMTLLITSETVSGVSSWLPVLCVRLKKDQLNLQSVDVVTLKESLQVEQQRCRQLWDDRETVVTRLHSQVRQLQQGRDDYYTKNQELQVDA